MKARNPLPLVATLLVACARITHAQASAPSVGDWPAYGRDAGGTRFSPLAQITRANVAQLRPAWTYRTGDMLAARSRFEATPLMIDGVLYLSTPLGTVVALDPARGTQRWRYDPHVDLGGDYGDFANRGVSAWSDARASRTLACARRIFVATVDARLIALDAATGRLCADFGDAGTVDLAAGLSNRPDFKGEYGVTSPPAIVGDLVIVGSAVADNQRTDAPNGVVRAFDARTGRVRWSWDPVPRTPGARGYDTWRGTNAHNTGAANAWSILSADPARDLVFIPVGSASPDFFGGERLGDNLYANSVVALRASTGQMVWHFQVVHHDLWDYDVPAQPVLFTYRHDGRETPAVAVGTKMGHVFILDRTTGKPLVPVEERQVPQTDVPGEVTSPTQPFPPDAFRLSRNTLARGDAFGVTPADRDYCRARITAERSDGIFAPPSLRGTIDFPGHIGGINWSGLSIDEATQTLIAPVNALALDVTLVPRDDVSTARHARPADEYARQRGTPYAMLRSVVAAKSGVPCNPPPWGTLAAIDLATGATKWRVPLGFLPALASVPESRQWGSPSLGGVLLTRGGLAFVAGTFDQTLRAFDVTTGREVWSAPLPAGGHALPMTYEVGGRQYVVICAGGHDRLNTKQGDYVIAYALPANDTPAPATRPLAHEFAGQFRVGDGQDGVTVQLAPAGDALAGTLTLGGPRLAGSGTVRVAGDSVHITATFTYAAKHCDGTIAGVGAVADEGQLLTGDLAVTTSCEPSGHVAGTFALWSATRR